MTKTRRLSLAALLCCCCAPLQSCFTMAMLHTDVRGETKVALAPFTVAADIVTLPLQVEFFGSRGSRRCR